MEILWYIWYILFDFIESLGFLVQVMLTSMCQSCLEFVEGFLTADELEVIDALASGASLPDSPPDYLIPKEGSPQSTRNVWSVNNLDKQASCCDTFDVDVTANKDEMDEPQIGMDELKMVLDEPWMVKGEPWMVKGEPWMVKDEPWMVKDEPRMVMGKPKMVMDDPQMFVDVPLVESVETVNVKESGVLKKKTCQTNTPCTKQPTLTVTPITTQPRAQEKPESKKPEDETEYNPSLCVQCFFCCLECLFE